MGRSLPPRVCNLKDANGSLQGLPGYKKHDTPFERFRGRHNAHVIDVLFRANECVCQLPPTRKQTLQSVLFLRTLMDRRTRHPCRRQPHRELVGRSIRRTDPPEGPESAVPRPWARARHPNRRRSPPAPAAERSSLERLPREWTCCHPRRGAPC